MLRAASLRVLGRLTPQRRTASDRLRASVAGPRSFQARLPPRPAVRASCAHQRHRDATATPPQVGPVAAAAAGGGPHQPSPHPSGAAPSRWEAQRPKRIILVRHGESEGNLDETAYTYKPDNKIELTPLGVQQADATGAQIRRLMGDGDSKARSTRRRRRSAPALTRAARRAPQVYFYVSPYVRTLQTLLVIGKHVERHRIMGVREEPRIREQARSGRLHARGNRRAPT